MLEVLSGTALVVLLAQAPSQAPTFRSRTELVQLDVVVVDTAGIAIRGLTAAEFEIRDRGRARPVATVEEVSHARGVSAVFPPDVRRDVADNTAFIADRLVVVIMDDLHFQAKTELTKTMARRVVEEVGDGAAFALITTSGSFGMEPTTDRAQVLAEIDRFVDKFDPEGKRTIYGEVTAPEPGPIRNAMGESVAVRGPKDLASFFGNMTGFKALQDAAKRIAADPSPRKTFVWISGGMAGSKSVAGCDGRPVSDSVYCGVQASLLDALRKANVSAYPIDTGDFRSALLRDVAENSGGFVVKAADFDAELPRLVGELDHYYLLGFYPDEEGEKGSHKIEVRVTRPGAVVRHRAGYESAKRTTAGRGSELARLSEGTLPVAGLPLRLQAAAAPGAGKAAPRTAIAIEVTRPHDVAAAVPDTLRYEVWAIDLKKKKVVASIAREARVETTAPSYQVHTALALAPGRYQLRASATSAALSRGGSVFAEIVVPDYRKAPLEIGPVSVAYADGQRVPVIRGGLGVGLFPAPITLDRQFAIDDALRITADVVQRAKTEVNVEVDLFTAAGDRGRRLLQKTLSPSDPHTLEVLLDMAGLVPGAYRVQIRTSAGASSIVREVPFLLAAAPVR